MPIGTWHTLVYTTLGKDKKSTQMDVPRKMDIQKGSCPLTGTLPNNSMHRGKISLPKCISILRALSPSPQTAPSSGQSPLLPSLGHKAQPVKHRHFHPSVLKGQGLQGHPSPKTKSLELSAPNGLSTIST